MIKRCCFLSGVFILLLLGCDDEEIKIPLTNDHVVQLLAGDSIKNWTLIANSKSTFDPCLDTKIYQFKKSIADTSELFILKPKVLCDVNEPQPANDTLDVYHWIFADSTAPKFINEMIFIKDGNSFSVEVSKINPIELKLKLDPNLPELHEFKINQEAIQ